MEQIKFLVEEKHRGKWQPLILAEGKRIGQQKRVIITEEEAAAMNVHSESYGIRYVKAEKGGSPEPPKKDAYEGGESLDSLRAAYKEKFGKAPFNGWKEDKLKEKLAE